MDGTIPRKRLGEMLQAIQAMETKYAMRCINVFHAGDGNLHPLILFDANKPGDQHTAEAFGAEILELSVALGGTITGEHGVGIEKINQMCSQFATPEIAAFHRVKAAFDPGGLLNPGKAIPTLNRCAEYGRSGWGWPSGRTRSAAFLTIRGGCDFRRMAAVPVCCGAGVVPGGHLDGVAHGRSAGAATQAAEQQAGKRRMSVDDLIRQWRERVRRLRLAVRPCACAVAGPSASMAGRSGERLDTRACRGIVNYEPSELVVTVRAGTPLVELEAALAAQGQMLAFEPPHFEPGATIGGCIAAGLAGRGGLLWAVCAISCSVSA
jgi:hypothetical protein